MITKDLPVYSVREDRLLPQDPSGAVSEEKPAAKTSAKSKSEQNRPNMQSGKHQRSSLQQRLF